VLFHKPADYDAFARILAEALSLYPVDLFAYCLMPNHWHLLLAAREDGAISAFMRWVGVTHVRRHHEHYRTRGGGHLYQGRFKAFPVADGPYFRAIAHYVEANAWRANLCDLAQSWPWGSAAAAPNVPVPLAPWPCARPDDWPEQLNRPQDAIVAARASVAKGRPFGPAEWAERVAARDGLGHTLRPAGRPRKRPDQPLAAASGDNQ
jgi:putative transposase